MNKLNVLILPPSPALVHPWKDDVVEAIGERHHQVLYDVNLPLKPQFEGIHAVVDCGGGSVSTTAMADVAGSVLLWQLLSNGIDHFNLEYFRSKNIQVANCPGENTAIPLAEQAVMFMLQLSRNWHSAQRNLHKRVMYSPMGCELAGKTLGLVGFGATGRQLAKRAKSFDMRVIAIDKRKVLPAEKRKFGVSQVYGPESLDDLLRESDYVSLHLHLTPETRHIINAQRLATMKKGSFLINVARGALVDEQALSIALASGHLGGAGLDTYAKEPPDAEDPLLRFENVIATPHIAGATSGTSKRRAAFTALNIDRIASGLDPLGLIFVRSDVGEFRNLSDLLPPAQNLRADVSSEGSEGAHHKMLAREE